MARRVREHDWGSTPLGPIEAWPQSLKTVVDIMLASPSMMSLVWGAEAIHLYNDSFAELLREHDAVALGRSAFETFARSRDVFAADVAAGRAGKSARLLSQRYPVLRDGVLRDAWFDVDYAPVRDERGDVAGVLWTLKEITNYVLAERALRESETRHRLLVESWAQAVWETDAEGVVVKDSPSWRAYTGQTLDEWLGYGWLDAIHPDDREYAERQWREAVAAKAPVNAESRLRSRDGGYRWTNVRAAPVLDNAGNIEKWAGINIDIDQRKRAEEALRESEERYRVLFESMNEGVVTLDLMLDAHGRAVDATYVETNAAFGRMTGLTIDIGGRRLREVFPNLEPFWFEALRRIVATGKPERFEHAVHDLEGMWFDCFASRVGGEGSRRIVVVFNNITVRKRTEAVLRESEERQAFLLQLSDALRPYEDPSTIMATASALTGPHLGLDRCFYGEVDAALEHVHLAEAYCARGVPAFPQRVRIDDFGEELVAIFATGSTLAVDDISNDPVAPSDRYRAVQIGAFVGVPLVKEGRLVAILSAHQSSARQWTHNDITLLEEVAQRTWSAVERARAEAAMRESAERLRVIVENAEDYAIFTTDPDGMVTDWREGAEAVFGYSSEEMLGQDCVILFTPEDRAWGVPEQERVTAAAEGKAPDVRWHMRKDGSRVFIDGISSALRGRDGALEGFLKIGQDVTERHFATERQQLLLAELQHRVRNTLGMIRSLVRFTAEGHDDLEDYLSHLTGRIESLSRTQQLLTRSSNARVDLRELVSDEMTAQAGGRSAYKVEGPDVMLAPKAAEVLSLALHELVTNSVKYGALGEARDTGSEVDVGWNVTRRADRDWLELHWRERAQGQHARQRRGFGTELITERVPYELRGEASLVVGDGEVVAHIAFPLEYGPGSLLQSGAPRGVL